MAVDLEQSSVVDLQFDDISHSTFPICQKLEIAGFDAIKGVLNNLCSLVLCLVSIKGSICVQFQTCKTTQIHSKVFIPNKRKRACIVQTISIGQSSRENQKRNVQLLACLLNYLFNFPNSIKCILSSMINNINKSYLCLQM